MSDLLCIRITLTCVFVVFIVFCGSPARIKYSSDQSWYFCSSAAEGREWLLLFPVADGAQHTFMAQHLHLPHMLLLCANTTGMVGGELIPQKHISKRSSSSMKRNWREVRLFFLFVNVFFSTVDSLMNGWKQPRGTVSHRWLHSAAKPRSEEGEILHISWFHFVWM